MTAIQPEDERPSDESDLVARTLHGDCEAFAAIYARHAAAAYAAAHRLLASAADAEDVVQELFLALPGTLSGYDPTRGALGPWLRRVAVRLALMRLRSVKRRRETDAGSVAALLARDDAALERLSIEAALARLSDGQRTVFLLKEVEGYEHREIAALLDISVANSEIRLFRARQALRALLGGSR
ncbi:MAG TPA: RNA polymerase sigma factor [Gemmatimonadaceae bacterium]|nr:RNA polymerase sigma factor [Gemmatimonadaceae bacterium]